MLSQPIVSRVGRLVFGGERFLHFLVTVGLVCLSRTCKITT